MTLKKHPVLIVRVWLGFVIALFLLLSVIGLERSLHERDKVEQAQHARMDPNGTESGRTKPATDEKLLATSKVARVIAGLYVDRIINVSIPDASWTTDFYLWFRWRDGHIHPGDNFQVIDGQVVSKELITRSTTNGEHYALYWVQARITKFFNTTFFPRDHHLLTITIEDRYDPIYRLQYVADEDDTNISSRSQIQGYEIVRKQLVSKIHSYQTRFGNTDLPVGSMDTYSQLIYGIWIERPDWGVYIKMFEGLYAAVAVALLTFFISVTGTSRISLGVGSFFAAVAANYVAERSLPPIGILTLTNIINGVALLTIFLTICHTIIVTRLFEVQADGDMIRRYDRTGFAIFLVGFITVNTALVILTVR
jgi:hypothetical protein